MSDRTSGNLAKELIKKGFLPFFTVLVLLLLYLVYAFKYRLFLSDAAKAAIRNIAVAAFTVGFAFWIQRIFGVIITYYQTYIAGKTKNRWDNEFMPLLRRVTNTIIWVIVLLIILSNFGININAIIAALGVGSLAIALAAQDTIANIIAGFLIMLDRPFRIGDTIKLPSGEKARVLDIGIRRSKFLGEDKSIIIVPNLDLSKSKIVNFTYGEKT